MKPTIADPSMRRWRVACAIVIAGAMLAATVVPATVLAFAVTTISQKSQTIKRWNKQSITYYISPKGSDDMPAKDAVDAVKASFKDWQDVSCGGLKFQAGYHCNTALGKCLFDNGKTCKSDLDCPAAVNTSVLPITGKYNKRNEFVWVENSQWKHGNYVLGVTVAITNYAGQIVESDIAMNGSLQKWTNDPFVATKSQGTQHVKSVAIHEIGHFFGVQHMLGGWKPDDPPTMAPNVMPNGLSASLSEDDKKAICFLNPASGSYSCKNDSDCPYINHKSYSTGKEFYSAKLKCQSNKCLWGPPPAGGQTTQGGTCASDNDCFSGLFCVPLTSSLSLCSKQCTVNSTACGAGFYCHPQQQGASQGICLPDAAKWDGNPTASGQGCLMNYQCQSQLCFEQTCRTTCAPSNPGKKCDLDKEACQQLDGQSIGICVSTGSGGTGDPTIKKAGEECYAPEECQTGVCMKDNLQATVGKCREPCTGPGTCTAGFKCVDQGGGYQGCQPGAEVYPTGAPCKLGSECQSGECVVDGAAQFCTQKCSATDPLTCPCGMECHDKGPGPRCFSGKPVACLEAGDPCGGSAECKSGLCPIGTCLAGCDVVEGPIGCPEDSAGCLRLQSGKKKGRCAVPGKAPIGEVCKEDADCTTMLCAADPDAAGGLRCIQACDPGEQACGGNLSCHKISDEIGVCAKAALGSSSGGGSSSGASSSGGATDAASTAADGSASSGGTVAVPVAPAGGGSSGGCSAGPQRVGQGSFAGLLLALAALLIVARRRRLA